MDTTVVNIGQDGECDVYIGRKRDGIWGNPFIVNRHGNRKDVIGKHRPYLIDQFLSGDRTWEQIKDLHGQVLGCHCYPQACHGDTLKYFADMAVTFDTEEEWLEFVRKEKGEKDERPPEVRLQHLKISRSTFEKKLENAQQMHRKASGGPGDMRVYDALLQQSEVALKECNEEIEALEKEVGVQPVPPQPRKTKPARPKKRKQEPKQQSQETTEMSTQQQQVEEQPPAWAAGLVARIDDLAAIVHKNQNEAPAQPAAPAAPAAPPRWTVESTNPNTKGRQYTEVKSNGESVVHMPLEHYHDGVFHAVQKDDINPPPNRGAGKILIRTELIVDTRYVGRITATPDQCPHTLQAMLGKFGELPRHQKVGNTEFEEQAEHKHYRYPNPEKTAVETVTAEEREAKQEVRTTTPPSSNGATGYDEEVMTERVKELKDEGLTNKEIQTEIREEDGVAISLPKISKLLKK